MPTRTAERLLVCLVALAAGACASVPAEERVGPGLGSDIVPVGSVEASGAPVMFRYPDVRGGELTSDGLQGRVSVLLFMTTYDVPSQAEVLFLTRLHKEHTPRLNVALIVLEPPESRDIVKEYVRALKLEYPVGMADAATIRGSGPFAKLQHVPSIVILDKGGRERFRHLGPMKYFDMEAAVRTVETDAESPK